MGKKIVVVHIEKKSGSRGIFERTYRHLFKLEIVLKGVTLELVKMMDDLKGMLEQNPPDVIIFGDEVITKTKYEDFVQTSIKPFMESGGLVLLALDCLTFSLPPDFDRLMDRLGLPWKYSAYHRTDFQLTSAGKALYPNLPEQCNVKAVQLSNVLPEHRIYTPAPGATNHSLAFFMADIPTNPDLAMMTFTRIGAGGLGTVGDVNAEKLFIAIITYMCSIHLTN